MKKLLFLFTLLIIAPVVLFSQVFPGDTSTVPNVPENVYAVLDNPALFFGQLGGVVGLVILIVGALILIFKVGGEKKWPKVVLSFIVAVVLAVLQTVVNWGLFADSTWINTILGGLGVGAVAGGLIDIPTMKIILNIILSVVQFKKPTV